MKKTLLVIAVLIMHGTAAAQTSQEPVQTSQQPVQQILSYNYAELRFVDVDTNGGDGFEFGGSLQLDGPWILIGAITAVDFNNDVDSTRLELGGGYVWNYSNDLDLIGTLSLVRLELETPGNDFDDTGIAFSAGARGLLTPDFEVRGSVNHVNLDNSDTYLELAGDYYFTKQISAGLSLEFAGDTDVLTLGARWFFK